MINNDSNKLKKTKKNQVKKGGVFRMIENMNEIKFIKSRVIFYTH